MDKKLNPNHVFLGQKPYIYKRYKQSFIMVLLDIASWWGEKEFFEQIFWFIAIPASIIFIIILITTFIGGSDMDSDVGDVDAEIDGDAGIGFQFFTFKNLVGFFTVFSWTGISCIDYGFGVFATMGISFFAGILTMTLMATVFYFMTRMVEDGTLKIRNSIGRIGEVYLPIPAKGEGFGKVSINVQGSLREMDAMTKDDTELRVGMIVKVLDVIDEHILLVTKNS